MNDIASKKVEAAATTALIAMLLLAGMAHAGFGEVGGLLAYYVYPNSSQTVSWGLINDGNTTLHFTIYSPRINPNNNFSLNDTPTIVFNPQTGNISADSVFYVGVNVITTGLKVNQSWSGLIQATTTPLGNGAGANLQMGTVKEFNIDIIHRPIPPLNITVLIAVMVLSSALIVVVLAVAAYKVNRMFTARRRKPFAAKGKAKKAVARKAVAKRKAAHKKKPSKKKPARKKAGAKRTAARRRRRARR